MANKMRTKAQLITECEELQKKIDESTAKKVEQCRKNVEMTARCLGLNWVNIREKYQKLFKYP